MIGNPIAHRNNNVIKFLSQCVSNHPCQLEFPAFKRRIFHLDSSSRQKSSCATLNPIRQVRHTFSKYELELIANRYARAKFQKLYDFFEQETTEARAVHEKNFQNVEVQSSPSHLQRKQRCLDFHKRPSLVRLVCRCRVKGWVRSCVRWHGLFMPHRPPSQQCASSEALAIGICNGLYGLTIQHLHGNSPRNGSPHS